MASSEVAYADAGAVTGGVAGPGASVAERALDLAGRATRLRVEQDVGLPLDRQAMRFAFDLWSYKDVSRHADAILGRLKAGTMPCDGAWAPGED